MTFATSGTLAKAVMDAGWSPMAVTTVRIGVSALVMLALVALLRPGALRFPVRSWGLIGGYALLGVAGAQLSFFVAVAHISVSLAMLLEFLAPALVALWVRVVRRTPLPRLVWFGIALAVIGLSLVAEVWQGLRLDLTGIGAGLFSSVSTAGYYLIGEHGAGKHDAMGMLALGLLVGAVIVGFAAPPWTLPANRLGTGTTLGPWHVPVWCLLVLIVLLSTIVPYVTGLLALRGLASALASVIGLLEPLVATVIAWLLLGQALDGIQILGAIAVLTGAVLVQIAGPPAEAGPELPPLTPE
jgi:drug/metabolite transporter (DMT)-like permease